MSTLIHCDGPGCTETAPAVQARTYDWLRVEQDNAHAAHFHSRACLAAWSSGASSTTTTTVMEPMSLSDIPAVGDAVRRGVGRLKSAPRPGNRRSW